MPTQDKIEIYLSSGSSFYFKAVQFKPNPQRPGQVEQTFSGIDVTIGPVVESFKYVLRVELDDTSGSEGNYDDLYNILQLSNPASEPSPMFRFVDHFGVLWNSAWFRPGQHDINPLTTQLEGPNAYMMVGVEILCQFYEFPDHTDFSDPDQSYNIFLWFS